MSTFQSSVRFHFFNSLRFIFGALGAFSFSAATANATSIVQPKSFEQKPTCTGTPHTVHVISVNKDATCVLSRLYEPEKFCLVDENGKNISEQSFPVTAAQGMKFGMIFDNGADFNMEYALTCAISDGAYAKSPKVVFTVGADGPADPSITVVNLYGAQGDWKSTSVGENYFLNF